MVLGTDNPFPTPVSSFQVPVLPPGDDPDAGAQTTVCFSAEWLPLVIGALQQLTLQSTWLGELEDTQLAQDRAQLLIAMFGSASGGCQTGLCITDLIYDADCDCILWTPPGSITPVEAPGYDPRHAPVFRYPPIDAEDQACQAAANMSRFIENLIGEVILVVDAAGTAEGLLAILLPFVIELGPFGILIDLVLGLAFVLFSAGAAAIAAAFTPEVYDQLICIFYCDIDDQGQVSAEQLENILADVDTQIGGLVSSVLSAMFFLMGEVGLSNAGAVGDAPADCDECACAWCYEWTGAEIVDGGWSFPFDGQGGRSVYVAASFSSVLTHIEFTYTSSVGTGTNGAEMWDTASFTGSIIASHVPTPGSPDTLEWDGNQSFAGVSMGENAGDGGSATITHILLRGVGAMPAFSGGNDCEP